ncbi:MAG: dihydropteroate synthase-like protein [Candidatus Bathyarchaeota archaeon]|nr:dihydropteroate synthase-like protein [Candidatus Bathyarchaeota archaeon]
MLLVTGILAEETVKQYVKDAVVHTQVFVINVPVAAFLSPETISQALKNKQLDGFDTILVPGLMRGNTEAVSKAVGVSTFKGPRYAADLPTVLESLNEVTLSTTVPACDLLRDKLRQKALQELEKVEANRAELLKKPHNLLIKNLPVGKDFPMRVLAEIVDAALMPDEEIQRLATRFVQQGADLIDVGMFAGESRPEDARRIVKAVKAVVDVPVSIDTLDPAEIEAAVSAGVDLILSLDAGNLEQIAPFAKDVAVVAIPTNQREGHFPKKASDRVGFLENIITKAKKLGFTKILGDLILEPSNVLESFVGFRDFGSRNPDVPLFVGVSNVTELMDADSVGVNALLARLSAEMNVGMLLATEKSDKAKGTVAEEVTAAKMMFLAKKRGSVPKDLGLTLLVLKDKRNREEPYNRELEKQAPVIQATENNSEPQLDKKGIFRVAVDREEEAIVALHFISLDIHEPDAIIKGKTAEDVYRKIAEMELMSSVDHAAYLGGELAKAEVALRTGKEYIQDSAMFVQWS